MFNRINLIEYTLLYRMNAHDNVQCTLQQLCTTYVVYGQNELVISIVSIEYYVVEPFYNIVHFEQHNPRNYKAYNLNAL